MSRRHTGTRRSPLQRARSAVLTPLQSATRSDVYAVARRLGLTPPRLRWRRRADRPAPAGERRPLPKRPRRTRPASRKRKPRRRRGTTLDRISLFPTHATGRAAPPTSVLREGAFVG